MITMQHDSAEDEIQAYIEENFTVEYASDLLAALSLIYAFELEGVQDTLCEMIYDPSREDTESHTLAFSTFIVDSTLSLLEMQGIVVELASLCEIVAILSATLLVQNCEDPVPYLRVLELNTIGDEEKIALILRDFCYLDETKLISLFAEIRPSLPGLLYNHLLTLEQRSETEEDLDIAPIVDNFRLFESCFGKNTFGNQVLSSGMMIGLPFSVYISYIAPQTSDDKEGYVMDIFSLLLLASDTYNRPVAAFREMSETLLHDPKDYQWVETAFQKINEQLEQYRKEKA